MSKWKKGESGNPKGKPKGAVSEKTKIWNEVSEWFAGEALELYKTNLLELMISEDAKVKAEAMKRYEALLEYFKPKLSRTDIKADVDSKITIDFTD